MSEIDPIARRIDQLERESAAFQAGFLREVERIKARIEKLERAGIPYDPAQFFKGPGPVESCSVTFPHDPRVTIQNSADPLGR